MGIGDDAAVIGSDQKPLLISTDTLVEGLHFDLIYNPLKHLGYKAVVVSISDIYAMNGVPEQIIFALSVSNKYSVEAVDELYQGIQLACERYGVDLVGGDTTSSLKGMFLNITAIGVGKPNKVVYRSTAKENDLLCVSGDLGGAYVGLQLLEREKKIFLESPGVQPDLEGQRYCVGRQLKPEARHDIIEKFEEVGLLPTSMIDISDGLSSEILHLCKSSEVGCLLNEEQIPIYEETFDQALKFNIDPTTCALNGGEDYELLFTIDPSDEEKLSKIPDTKIIGRMTDYTQGAKLNTRQGNVHNLIAQGWKSFSS